MIDGGNLIAEIGDVLEAARPWLSTTALTASAIFLGLLLKHHLGLKRIALDKEIAGNADEADIRDHYADEVRQLRERLDGQSERHRIATETETERHKEEMAAADRRHEECVNAREELREKVWALKDQVMGLVRLLITNSARGTLALSEDEVSGHVREAAERVERLFAPNEEKLK